jgi:tetratricopeptide (TPR) repeat protein
MKPVLLSLAMLLMIGLAPSSPNAGESLAGGKPFQISEQDGELAQALELSARVVKLYKDQRFAEALPLAQRVVEIRQRLLPAGDVLVGSAFLNLGQLYLALKKDSEAEKSLQSALSVYESHPKEDPLLISSILDGLAYIRVRKRDFERAEPLLLRSITIQEKQLGPTNPTTVEAMKSYACVQIIARSTKGKLFGDGKDESEESLRARATCWLGGLVDNCADAGKVKPEGVLNIRALRLVQPPFPAAAREKRLSGRAFIAILIDEAGDVINATPVCGGYAELNAASAYAARLSKFTPTKVDQKPVRVTGLIVYNFVVQ